jgi:hypothetical protein
MPGVHKQLEPKTHRITLYEYEGNCINVLHAEDMAGFLGGVVFKVYTADPDDKRPLWCPLCGEGCDPMEGGGLDTQWEVLSSPYTP